MSTRAIGVALGVSKSQVADDLRGVQNRTPDPTPVTGLDGTSGEAHYVEFGSMCTIASSCRSRAWGTTCLPRDHVRDPACGERLVLMDLHASAGRCAAAAGADPLADPNLHTCSAFPSGRSSW